MDFNNHIYYVVNLWGDWRLLITETTFATWFAGAVLIALGIVVRVKMKKFKPVPETRFQNIIELMVEMMENFVKGSLGEKYASLSNWFFGVIALIWVMNMEGLIGIRNATGNVATTLAFALTTFFILHYMWMKTKKFGYVKEYFEPFPVFVPMNIISELSLPLSLGFRLFGNVLGGIIIMGLIYGMVPVFLKVGLPSVLHVYFDIWSGSLQAFIFTILSMTFIRNKLPE